MATGHGSRNSTTDTGWTLGPAESRLVRVCFYLAEGALGGAILFSGLATVLGPGALDGLAVGFPVDAWQFALATTVAVLVYALAKRIARRTDDSRAASQPSTAGATETESPPGVARPAVDRWGAWVGREWLLVRRWRWSGMLVGLFLIGLGGVHGGASTWAGVTAGATVTGVLVLGFCSLALGYFSCSAGSVDPDSRTLLYLKPPVTTMRERGSVDLRYVRSVRSIRFRSRALVWLGFVRGTPRRFLLQGFYVLPVQILDRYRPVFDVGDDPPLDPAARATALRRESLAILAGYVLLTLGVALGLLWSGLATSIFLVVLLATVLAAVGAVVLVEAVSTI